ncbi:MAG TPA: DUF2288 family protein [Halothiobacillus sp.]|nr:MAG: hypothetical protein B7Z82_00805 [Halothiobacillus sp. 20-54-6]HQT43802.1 DUF2288 family protein [Halothiobacillus sp.]
MKKNLASFNGSPIEPEKDLAEDRWALFFSQTAKISWVELAPLFARGQVVRIADSLDLVAAAVAVAEDDKTQVARWMSCHQFGLLDVATARQWSEDTPSLWAVVVNPWVLVQERTGDS